MARDIGLLHARSGAFARSVRERRVGQQKQNARGYRTEHTQSHNIDEHVALIKRQLDRSLQDAEVRQLAVKIVSCHSDDLVAWGKRFHPPEVCPAPRDEEAEVAAIWDFVVLNCRYVYDPLEVDTFATVEHTLDAGGGDCDDLTIVFAALLKSVGFHVQARVISTRADPQTWAHIYPLVGLSKDNPRAWVPLDATVNGAIPGWEYEEIGQKKDYPL